MIAKERDKLLTSVLAEIGKGFRLVIENQTKVYLRWGLEHLGISSPTRLDIELLTPDAIQTILTLVTNPFRLPKYRRSPKYFNYTCDLRQLTSDEIVKIWSITNDVPVDAKVYCMLQ